MYKYQIQKGAEARVFAGDGVRNLGDGTVESDHELTSPYLTVVEGEKADEREQTQMTATPDKPAQPAQAAVPPAPVVPAEQTKTEEGAK
jgi:hypothetical protein